MAKLWSMRHHRHLKSQMLRQISQLALDQMSHSSISAGKSGKTCKEDGGVAWL